MLPERLSTRRAAVAIRAAAELFGVEAAHIVGTSRCREVIAPRYAVALALTRLSGSGWSAVARQLNRTHWTVRYAVARAEAWEAADAEFAAAVALITHEARMI